MGKWQTSVEPRVLPTGFHSIPGHVVHVSRGSLCRARSRPIDHHVFDSHKGPKDSMLRNGKHLPQFASLTFLTSRTYFCQLHSIDVKLIGKMQAIDDILGGDSAGYQ